MAANLARRRAKRQSVAPSKTNARRDFAPSDRRQIFAAQARLLAARAEAGLEVDLRSLRNLVIVFVGGQVA